MIHIKRGKIAKRKHKKIIKKTKGYYGARSKTYKIAKQSFIKANQYAYRDRKNKKRYFKKLWIIKLNAAARKYKISYNKLMYGLKKQKININKKILSQIVIYDQKLFEKIIKNIKNKL